jgi:hypothetical protein
MATGHFGRTGLHAVHSLVASGSHIGTEAAPIQRLVRHMQLCKVWTLGVKKLTPRNEVDP